MKRKWVLIGLLTGVMLQTSMTALAAPKQMSDGTVFDAAYYASSNPDVKAIFGTNEQNLYMHYKMFGKNEGRLPVAPTEYPTPATQQTVTNIMENGFDPVYYANNNKDVVAVIGNDPQQLYLHYTLFGKSEGRKGCAPDSQNTNTSSNTSSATGTFKYGLDETQYNRVVQRADSNVSNAKSLVNKINDYRDDKDKKKVYRDDLLADAATLLAMEMDDNERASSTRPNGSSYSSVLSQFGISGYEYHGMIYQKNNTSDMSKLLEEWKSDSSDRSELQNKHYKYVGVGRSNKYWVLLFTD
ncbi:CAP domain-containing protein [Lachnospiraceae bacterium JLR.KK008]